MNREYYDLLGLNEDATDEEIKERYGELKKKYNEDRWLDGEAGNEAARMLNKLDTAYTEIMSARREQSKNTEGKDAFQEIADLLKSDKLSEAQSRLDEFNERGAEWHYLQAVVFYKKIGRTRAKAAGNRHADGSEQSEISGGLRQVEREKRLCEAGRKGGGSLCGRQRPARKSRRRSDGRQRLFQLHLLLLYLPLRGLSVQSLLRLQVREAFPKNEEDFSL
ncbi:MAG: J domain-containing protein [Christensenellaceae bacterium]